LRSPHRPEGGVREGIVSGTQGERKSKRRDVVQRKRNKLNGRFGQPVHHIRWWGTTREGGQCGTNNFPIKKEGEKPRPLGEKAKKRVVSPESLVQGEKHQKNEREEGKRSKKKRSVGRIRGEKGVFGLWMLMQSKNHECFPKGHGKG